MPPPLLLLLLLLSKTGLQGLQKCVRRQQHLCVAVTLDLRHSLSRRFLYTLRSDVQRGQVTGSEHVYVRAHG